MQMMRFHGQPKLDSNGGSKRDEEGNEMIEHAS
jgi:hypothetical protein